MGAERPLWAFALDVLSALANWIEKARAVDPAQQPWPARE